MQTEKAERIQQLTDAALQQLSDSLAVGRSEALKRYLTAMAKFHRYSFGNQLLIAFQRPDATHVAGFQTWKKLGRYVKAGEKGILIIAPVKRRVAKAELVPADGGSDGEAEASADLVRVVSFTGAYVFDISQTDGQPLPEFAKVSGEPADYTARLKALIAAKGIGFEYATSLGGAQGLSCGNRIQLLLGLEPATEFSVLAHELAHELLHRGERRRQVSKKVRETEAEAVAFVVCQSIGLETGTAASDYIQLYNGDRDTLAESLTHIRDTASEIILAI
jgi:hypothetical protein